MTARNTSTPLSLSIQSLLGGEAENSTQGADHFGLRLTETIHGVVVPFLCVVGILGNSMGILLIRGSIYLKRLASNMYLIAMATTSTVFLSVEIYLWVESFLPTLRFYPSTLFGCKVLTFVGGAADCVCVWLVVAVCLDRVVIVYQITHPCSNPTPNFVIGWITAGSFIAYSWILVIAAPEGEWCGIDLRYHDLYVVLSYVESIYGIVIPSIVVIIANLAVIYRLRLFRKHYTRTSFELGVRFSETEHRYSFDNDALLGHGTTTTPITPANAQSNGQRAPINEVERGALKGKDFRMTKTLLIVTSVFILLNSPNYMVRLWLPRQPNNPILFHLINLTAYILYYGHHTVVFLIYIFNSRQMRKQLCPTAIKLLECYCLKPVPGI